ncbi:MAG TPA: LysR family transcriptional regulator [Bacillota bacterium]|nr:LysR family transcriptional regulator [Bacillota bacterium]
MDVDFELYKVFYHVVKENSFSTAAERLFVSQSAISQNIKNLEKKLGVQLFQRKGRDLKMTQEGEWLYSYVQQAYNLFKTAESKINDFNNLEAGEVRIGASDTICRYYLLPYLQRFNREYPRVKIHFINRTSTQIRELLREGVIDFGVVTLHQGETGENVRTLSVVEDVFVASQKYASLKGKLLELKDLSTYPLLMLEKASTTRAIFESFLQEHNLKLVPEVELESTDLLVEFAKIGLGIAYVLKDSIREAVFRGQLFILRINEELPVRKIGFITNEEIPITKSAARFIDLVEGRE